MKNRSGWQTGQYVACILLIQSNVVVLDVVCLCLAEAAISRDVTEKDVAWVAACMFQH